MNVESEKKCEVDEGNGHDDKARDDPFEAVAEILLLEKGDRIRLSDHIRRDVWMVRTKIIKLINKQVSRLLHVYYFLICLYPELEH